MFYGCHEAVTPGLRRKLAARGVVLAYRDPPAVATALAMAGSTRVVSMERGGNADRGVAAGRRHSGSARSESASSGAVVGEIHTHVAARFGLNLLEDAGEVHCSRAPSSGRR